MKQRVLTRWAGQALVFTLIVLSVGVGCCLFDGHTHDHDSSLHGISFDLCLGLAILSVAAVEFTSVLIHPMPLVRPLTVRVASLHTPDPPPKFPSRF